MKLGVLVETEEGLDWAHWRTTCAAAERLGFDSIWISDHLQSAWTASRHGLDPWIALAAAAAETKRVVLGPLVSPITFREPALVARMAESLDELSGGRFVIGLGLGWNAEEHAAAGIDFPSVAERSRRLSDGIARIRRELGKRHVRVLIGGKGTRSTLPTVARYADEWNMTTASHVEFRSVSEQLNSLCRAAGREPAEIQRSVATGILIGRDQKELLECGERMRRRVQPLAQAEDVLEAARSMGWVVGTPGEVLAVLKALAQAGVDRVILGHYDLDCTTTLETIAQSVLPELEWE